MNPSGSIFYQDEYEQFYNVDWETINGLIDITTIIKQPYVWNEEPDAFIRNGILFRKGLVIVERQIIKMTDEGYEIIAEGSSNIVDYIQMNFPCGGGPSDTFKYHYNCAISDEIILKISDGSHWSDVTEDSNYSIWGMVNPDGSVSTTDSLEWIDVWSS